MIAAASVNPSDELQVITSRRQQLPTVKKSVFKSGMAIHPFHHCHHIIISLSQ